MVLRCFRRNLAHLKWKKDHASPSDQTGLGRKSWGESGVRYCISKCFSNPISVPSTKSKPNGSQSHLDQTLGKEGAIRLMLNEFKANGCWPLIFFSFYCFLPFLWGSAGSPVTSLPKIAFTWLEQRWNTKFKIWQTNLKAEKQNSPKLSIDSVYFYH